MRPEIICHIMSSVDGRLLPSRWTPPFDGTDPGQLFAEYAAIGRMLDTDAWMFGKTTAAEVFSSKFVSQSDGHAEAGTVHKGHLDSERLFITVDPEADICYTSDRLRGDNILTVLGTDASDDYLALLEKQGVSYMVVEDPTDLAGIMKAIHENFGIKKVSLQGGGIINGAILAAGLIDELSLVIYPGIDGVSGNPSIFEYVGPFGQCHTSGQSLELTSSETRANGIVWLRYRFHRK